MALTRNLLSPNPAKAHAEMRSRERGRSAGAATDEWPKGCEADDPKPGQEHRTPLEKCCRRATHRHGKVPMCERHWRAVIGGQT